MLTTSCPKCEKEVTVPSTAKVDSRVRCPLCSEEYTLEHVFAELPPLLELLDAPSTNGALAAHAAGADVDTAEVTDADAKSSDGMFDFDKGDGGTTATDESEEGPGGFALADAAETVPKSSGFDFGDGSSAAATGSGAATSTRTPRPRKKSASPMKAIIGVIIGGLLAFPIAQLTLWYLPGGWRIEQRDPAGVGQMLSGTFASFIVPSWVANPDGAAPNVDENEPTVEPATSVNNTQKSSDEPSELAGMLGANHKGNQSGNGRGGNGNGGNANNGNGNGGNGNGNATSGNTNSGSGGNNEPPPASSPVKNAPTYTASDLAGELKSARVDVDRFDDVNDQTVEPQERLTIRNDFFATMGKLAEVITFADERPDGHLEHVNRMLFDAASTPEKRRIIGVSALAIVKDKQREASGLVLSGTVMEIQKSGQLYESVVAVHAPDSPPISVYSADDPADTYDVGDDVMILGVIIDNPINRIRGYKGPREDTVLWQGYAKTVPVAKTSDE